ncbi:MAG: signal peptidase I [Sedimentisphaerales bacterium]|nr:signal peptidase I [Sedimentisphaerales bacterium]
MADPTIEMETQQQTQTNVIAPGTAYPQRRYNPAVESMVNTIEWVLIALILAFTFRAFVMEAFRIPTGSMAETLRGDHFNVACLRCGYRFDVGSDAYTRNPPRCPSCSFSMPKPNPLPPFPMSNGDRILVCKSLYQFVEPQRWDVVVFKNPTDPRENYIKRLIALPNEMVEIIDGDIYIDGRIARKPPRVQQELWMPVYLNDYQPTPAMIKNEKANDNGNSWELPFDNEEDGQWNLNTDGSTVFTLESSVNQVHTLRFDPGLLGFKGRYGYNENATNYSQPICSDLMTAFYVLPNGSEGRVGVEISKYGITYRATVFFGDIASIEKIEDGQTTLLLEQSIGEFPQGNQAQPVSFSVVDHQLVLQIGREEMLIHDLGRKPGNAGNRSSQDLPAVRLFGAGGMKLLHIGIYRDTYYISDGNLRAGEGEPFLLHDDEFFVCGDNSPNSLDARLWAIEGKGNNGTQYRMGVVPRDYMMGKAFYIYWGNAFRPHTNLFPIIPNIDQMGVICGGGG